MATTYSVDGKSFGSIGEAEDYLSGQGYDKYTIDDRRQGGKSRQTGVGIGEGAGFLAGAGGGGETFMGYGYTDPKTGQWVPASRDMVDGGGPGRSGNTFQGGPFSGILNALGVRPAGYKERQEAMRAVRPQARPEGLAGMAAAAAAAKQKQNASADNTSAAQNYGVTLPVTGPIPVEASLLPSTDPFMQMLQNAVNPLTAAEILAAPPAAAPSVMSGSPAFSNYGAGQFLRNEDNLPSVYGADAGYPSDVRPYMGLAPDYDYSPLHVYDDSRLSPTRRGFGDYMADIYGPLFGR